MISTKVARATLIQLTEELDIKGKLSGREQVFKDGEPHDILGMMLNRLGYQGQMSGCCLPPGQTTQVSAYQEAQRLLNISNIWPIINEIDRAASTNASIRACIFRVFGEKNPDPTRVHTR